MRRIAIGLLASSLLTLFTGAQASGLGARMERAMMAPSPEKIARMRRDPAAARTMAPKNVLIDGAGLAVLERGAPGGFRDHFDASTAQADNADTAGTYNLAHAAENTAGQAGPVLREAINALQLPATWVRTDDDFTAATQFLRDHASEQLRTVLAPIAAHCLDIMVPRPARSSLAEPRIRMSRQGLADHIALTTVDGLLATIARHEHAVHRAAMNRERGYFT